MANTFKPGASSGLTNPMTTAGDSITASAGGTPQRVAAGTAGQIYTTNGNTTSPSWGYRHFATYSSAITFALNDYFIELNGASASYTLPTAVGVSGQEYIVRHNGTSLTQVYTFLTTSGQTIGGLASGAIAAYTNNEVFHFYSDGANWQIKNHQCSTNWSTPVATSWSATSAYSFTITSSSVTIGAVYSNNGAQFICKVTIASLTTMLMSGTGAPAASGTLTLVSGTGPATIAFSAVTSTGQPVKATTKTNDSLMWRRIGANAEYWVHLGWASGTGAVAGSEDYVLFLPSNLFFDSNAKTYLPVIGNATSVPAAQEIWVGGTINGGVSSGSNNTAGVIPYINDSVSGLIAVRIISMTFATGAQFGPINGSSNFNFTIANFGLILKFLVPIAGWQP